MGVWFGEGLGLGERGVGLGAVAGPALGLVGTVGGVGLGVWLGAVGGRVGFAEVGAGLADTAGVEMTE